MFQHNFLTYSGKIIVSLFLEIAYFPVWWYSVGFFRFFGNVRFFLFSQERSLGFMVWAKNIFVPMYGQSDFAGRLISFFMRLFQVVFRGLIMLAIIFICLAALIIWLLAPILLILALFFQIFR